MDGQEELLRRIFGMVLEKVYSPKYESPLWTWIPSIAPSGMAFYNRNMFENLKVSL